MGVWSILISGERSIMIMLVHNDFAKDKGHVADPDCDAIWDDADSVGLTPHRIPSPDELPERDSTKNRSRPRGRRRWVWISQVIRIDSVHHRKPSGWHKESNPCEKMTAMDKKTSDLANRINTDSPGPKATR
jgi:hypothetical protein